MKLRKDHSIREVAGQYMLLPTGDSALTCSEVFYLSESAAWLWKALQDREFVQEDAVSLLKKEYEVDDRTALADVSAIIDLWRKIDLLYD